MAARKMEEDDYNVSPHPPQTFYAFDSSDLPPSTHFTATSFAAIKVSAMDPAWSTWDVHVVGFSGAAILVSEDRKR